MAEYEEKQSILVKSSEARKMKSSQGCPVGLFMQGDKITCGTFTIPPGKRLGRISAHSGDEIYYILRGTCKIKLPRYEKVVKAATGDLFYMPGGTIHAPFNDGKEETEIFWACAPEWP